MTQIDLGNIRINWRGTYNSTTNYARQDAISYKGSSYVAKRTVTGIAPIQGDDWDLMACGTDQLTQEGDLLTHNGTIPMRLARGSNAQILQMVDNQPAWCNQSLDPSRQVWKIAKVNGLGSWHTRVYLMADGTIKACGYGGSKANGDSKAMDIYTPQRVATYDPEVRFVDVFSGGQEHYALTADGEVWSWGENEYGQLGHGTLFNLAVAKRIEYFVENNIQITKIIPARPNNRKSSYVYFLTTDGLVYGCGYNNDGNLGNGTTNHQYRPVRCGGLTNIVDLTASSMPVTTYAVQDNGSLWVWGYNQQGQLGLGDKINRTAPILHPAFNNVVKALPANGYSQDQKATNGFGVIMLSDGTLWSTGYNEHGQLGLGDTIARANFTQIILPTIKFKDFFVGDGHYGVVGAITEQNDFYIWGYNGQGQIGMGNVTAQRSPQKPNESFQGQVSKVAFGGGHIRGGCILQAGNELWGAGYSENGNLGTNSFGIINSRFKRVLGQSGVIEDWNCYGQGTSGWGLGVLYQDGRVDACGCNDRGETGTQTSNLHNLATLTNVIF